MTNEQVKAEIMQIYGVLSPSKQQALDIAIKALEQEPCSDAISRQAVLALAKEECDTAIIPYKKFVKDVNALPPVTPQPKRQGIVRIASE